MATFNTTQKYLDLYGLQLFWNKARAYILANTTKVTSSHAKKDESDVVWVNVTDGGATANGITYNIDDTAINTKFNAVDAELAEIKANAGVTGIITVDADLETAPDYVKLTCSGSNPDEDGVKKGDVTITLDNSALDTKIEAIDKVAADEETSRVADEILLAGAKFTPGVDGATGSWAAEGAPTYKSITELSNALDTVNASLVTTVTEGDSKGEDKGYVKLDVVSETNDGKGDITVAIDVTGLNTKIESIDGAHATEVAARKAADAAIAGTGWDSENGAWSAAAPQYDTIAELSTQMLAAEAKIGALSSATHFRGVHASLEAALAAVEDYGDIVVVNAGGTTKEYIYNANPEAEGYVASVDNFVELGDTLEEETRLAYLEDWVGNGDDKGSYVTNADIEAMFVEGWTLPAATANRK